MTDKLYSMGELAPELGTSYWTLRRVVLEDVPAQARDRLGITKVGGRWVVPSSALPEIERLLRERESR